MDASALRQRLAELRARLREINGLLGPPYLPVGQDVLNRVRRIAAGK